MNQKLSIRDLTFIGMGAAILAVLSQFSIPIPFSTVPITLQVPAVILLALIYTPKQSFLSVIIFILLGAVGLPVFSNFHGGLNVILGPTGGYIIGFPLMALIIGYSKKLDNPILTFILVYIAIAVDYFTGVLQLSIVAHLSLQAALAAGLYPFIIKDIIVVFLTVLLGVKIRQRLSTALL